MNNLVSAKSQIPRQSDNKIETIGMQILKPPNDNINKHHVMIRKINSIREKGPDITNLKIEEKSMIKCFNPLFINMTSRIRDDMSRYHISFSRNDANASSSEKISDL